MATTPIVTTSATHGFGQLLMVAQGLQESEQDYNTANPNLTQFNNINIATDLDAQTVSITATIPVAATLTANGVTLAATDYLA
jgi:hypothetical protein